MDKALEDIGWFMQRVTVMLVTMPEHIVRQSVKLVVDNLLNDGMTLLFSKRMMHIWYHGGLSKSQRVTVIFNSYIL
jgi:hypothetical protein